MTAKTLPLAPDSALKALEDSRFRHFIESIRDYAMLMLDPKGNIVTWNAGAQAIKGYTAEEIIGRHFSTFYPRDAVESGFPESELVAAARDGRFEDDGWRIRKDGSRFWANVIITALRNDNHELVGFAKVTRDLTERREYEERLRESESRFRAMIESVRDYAIFRLDPKGHVATWNAGAETIKGYRPEEIIGKHFSVFYLEDAVRRGLPAIELQVAASEGRYEDEGWRLRKDGTRFWANVVLTSIRDFSGKLEGFTKITRDLTERREHESKLLASEERLRLLIDGVVDYAIITTNTEGFITTWNRGAQLLTGYTSDDIVGRHFSALYSPEDVAESKPWIQFNTARNTERVTDEAWRMRKDGTQYWSNNVLSLLRDADGKPHSFYLLSQDLSQRRNAESLADAAQRTHEFIAMLAHELRNPLAPIRNAATFMARKAVNDPDIKAMAATIDRQTGLLSRIVNELLDVNRVARGQFAVEKVPIDLRESITRAIETSQPVIDDSKHTLVVEMKDGPIAFAGDSMRLSQLVSNLLNNAAKYTPAGGSIKLQVFEQPDLIEIRVIDNGKGIARDQLDRVFDLFLQVMPTERSSVGGLGVGLALVRRIVELHGGSIHAQSDGLGKGAEFIVKLPVSGVKLPSAAVVPTLTGQAPLKILIVDDNRDSTDTMRVSLERLGHEVRGVYDGPAALAIVDEFEPDLVMLDLGLPGMTGYEVARVIRSKAGRHVVIAAVTGWIDDIARQRAREAGCDYHFAKPLEVNALANLLSKVATASV